MGKGSKNDQSDNTEIDQADKGGKNGKKEKKRRRSDATAPTAQGDKIKRSNTKIGLAFRSAFPLFCRARLLSFYTFFGYIFIFRPASEVIDLAERPAVRKHIPTIYLLSPDNVTVALIDSPMIMGEIKRNL